MKRIGYTLCFLSVFCLCAAGKKTASADSRTVTGTVVKDAPLDLCIGREKQNAIPCLVKLGYLDEDENEATAEKSSRNKSANTIGPGKGLLTNPGSRMTKPQFGTAGPSRQAGPESSPILLQGGGHGHKEGVGPHQGAKDKPPPVNPKQ